MLRPPFPAHRRYSITHRAVQRLRELVRDVENADDESLRDKLDEAIATAEDSKKAIRTLDAMLGEPQTLIPLDDFGETLYAIIKEETVVTVLPENHGQEILQRGQALEQRYASGEGPEHPPLDRWELSRRRWRREAPAPLVVERIVRGNGRTSAEGTDQIEDEFPPPALDAKIVPLKEGPKPEGPVAELLNEGLVLARRRAAVAALTDVLSKQPRETSLLPLWNAMAAQGVPLSLTVGDLLEAIRNLDDE